MAAKEVEQGVGKAIDYFQDLEDSLEPYLPTDKTARILDVGCGYGRVLAFLRKLGFTNAVGIDHDASVIAETRKTFGDSVDVVTDLQGYLDARRGQFDFIVLKDVIYYFSIDEVLPLLRAMRLCLKPRGHMYVLVFNGAQFSSSFTMEKDYGIRRVYNETSLRAVLQDSGFDVIALFGNKWRPKSVKGYIYGGAAAAWRLATRAVYTLERGACPNNPRILTPNVIAIATPKTES